ncbi:unnamed protein product [[Candida] boidinii]|nr:unnamed protein product [[Candida] boidinii]
MKQMIPNQYASHVLRVLLLILAGKELPSSIESNSILRSKKSKIARKMIEIKDSTDYQRSFQTPSSFQDELTDTLKIIYKDQTSKSLREMAIEKVASPVIQLLVQLEGLVDKKRSFWCLIFNDYEVESDKKEEAFVEYLLSDPVGSHFLEVAIDSQRHKNVERLYNYYMKDRVLKLAKRETTGAFVIMTLLKKMKPNHQIELLDQLVPHLNELIVNNLEIGKSVVDCSIARNNYKKDEIISKFIQFFNKDLSSSSNTEEEGNEGKDSGNDKVQSQLLENVLRLSTSTLGNTRDDWPTAEERRRALFLEKLISYDDKILMAVIEGLLDLPVERLIQMCCHGVFSHVVENVLIPERVDFITRKKILNRLMNHIIELTCNAQGSHIVDKLWPFTTKLNVYKDRIAEELINNKEMVKKSVYGKLVWKNWSLDMYIRRRGDWKRLIKEQELEKFPPKENDSESPNTGDKRPQYNNNTNGKRPFRNDRYNGGDRGNRGDFKRSRY